MFSYLIQNPPYNDVNGTMLHYKFLCKALEVAETVVSIQPATWMNQQKNRAGLPLNGRGATINIIQDTEHLFGDSNTNLPYSLSVSCFSRKYNDVLIDWGNGNSTRYPDTESIDTLDKFSMLRSIINKGYKAFGNMRLTQNMYGNAGGQGAANNRIVKNGSVLKDKWIVQMAPIIHSMDRLPNRWGLFTLGKNVVYQHDGNPDNLVGRCYCVLNTEKEARNCYAYLTSDLVRSYCIAFKTNSNLATSAPHIPWPATFDTDPALWTNEAISDRAGLEKEERQWLKEMLPDCYNIRKPAVPHGAAG